jgi:hypothetical protein
MVFDKWQLALTSSLSMNPAPHQHAGLSHLMLISARWQLYTLRFVLLQAAREVVVCTA